MSLLNGLLKGTGSVLKNSGSFILSATDRGPKSTEERVVKSIKNSMMKDNKLQFALIAFKDRYNFGMKGIAIEPQIDEDTLNITGWQAVVNKKVLVEADGLDELYTYFAKGVITNDKTEIELYKRETEAVLS